MKTAKGTKFVEVAGIADAHGIESYFPANEQSLSLYILRASLNRQRHAVCFKGTVPASVDKLIKKEIESGDFERALVVLKNAAGFGTAKIGLAGGGDVAGSWDLIPNPKLDPWH